jgi:hypothetical protein
MEPIDVEDMFEAVRDNLRTVSRLPASSSPTLPNLIVAPGRGVGWETSSSGWAVHSNVTLSAIATIGSKLLADMRRDAFGAGEVDDLNTALESEWESE